MQDDFESFANNVEVNIDAVTANNPFLTGVLGNFKKKSNSNGFRGVHIITSKLPPSNNLYKTQSKNLLSPPYKQEIRHYGKANVDHIRNKITEFPWERSFENNSANEKVNILITTIKNILPNYIPHKTIMCDDRDPPWINKNIKQLILEKNQAYNTSFQFLNQFQFLQTKLNFSNKDILKIIRNLELNKAHGLNIISIRMMKICDDSICKPLKLIFQSCLKGGKFPSKWKKANVVPIHKKGDKQIFKKPMGTNRTPDIDPF